MSSSLENVRPLVFVQDDGVIYASSVDVADRFEKRHDHILRDIDNMLEKIGPGAETLYFVPTTYIDVRNRTYPAYDMTRDGFTLLAMGFSGSRAMTFKLSYINAFNHMEQRLAGGGLPQPVKSRVVASKLSGALLREMRILIDNVSDTHNLSRNAVQSFASSVYSAVGFQLPLPVIANEEWTSTELANLHGENASVFGKKIKHLKIDEHGETRLATLANGRQVACWYWNALGKAAVAAHFAFRGHLSVV